MKPNCKKCNSSNIVVITVFEKYTRYDKSGIIERDQGRNYDIPPKYFCRDCEENVEIK